MRTSFAIAATPSAGLVAGAAGADRRQEARQGAFRNIVQAGGAEAFRPRDAVPAFVLVSRIAKAFRGCAEGRSRVRHRLLGHRAQPALESPRPAAGEESRRGRRRDRQGQERRRQDPARARLPRRARRHVRRLRQGRSPHAHRGLCEGHGAAGAALSERRRGADPLRAGAQHLGFAGRQDLRQPAQGRGDPGADLKAPAAASRRRALPDPPLRLSADRREGPRCGEALRQDRARRRRTRSTCRRTSSRASATGRSRSPPTLASARVAKEAKDFHDQLHAHGLPGLCLSAARAGQEGQGRHRRDDDGHRLHRDIPCRTLCAGRFAGALRGGTRRLEGRGGAPGPPEPARPCAGDHAFCARARRGPLGQSGSRQGGHRQARRAARQAASRPRTPIGPSRSISRRRSRPPGCSMPRASTTMRSRP